MDTVERLLKISSKLEHLESSAEWVTRETVHSDNALSQTGTLICILADQIREEIYALVEEIEKQMAEKEEQFTIRVN